MKSDLHCHSTASDGLLTPRELVLRAHAQGIERLALTDHDTLAGLPEAMACCKAHAIEMIAGIELSTHWSGIGIHIVGLNFDPRHPAMQQAVTFQAQARSERAQLIAARLEKRGFKEVLAGAQRIAGEGVNLGRPHIARYLVESEQIESVDQAFKHYLGAGKIGDIKCAWPDLPQTLSWIVEAGGVAVLAHPDKYNMTRSKLRRLIQAFKDAGGEAIEVVSGMQNPDVTAFMARLADEYGLYASCGSDFHGPASTWHDLGKYTPLPKAVAPVWNSWIGAEFQQEFV